jgi:uncharacterized protein (TIGR03437 family)
LVRGTIPAQSVEFSKGIGGVTQTYYRHQAVITGLQEGTDYSYRVLMNGEPLLGDDELMFRTQGIAAFQFLAVGDTGSGSVEQVKVSQRMEREKPRFVLHTGDLSYPTSTFENLERNYFDQYRGMMKRLPFFPCPGNHDYYETEAYPYVSVHDLPVEQVQESDQGRYFSFEWNNAHIVSLDTNTPLIRAAHGTGAMLKWFRSDLEKSKKFWNIVYFHHPPYAFGPNETDSLSAAARELITPIIDEFPVPVVFNGHEHSYQRSHPVRLGRLEDNGTVYVTTGGGGAPLYPVYENPLLAAGASIHHYVRATVDGYTMKLDTISLNGNEIDSVTIAPNPRFSTTPVLNSASFSPAIAAGGLVSIFGRQLAAIDNTATKFPLPTELSNLKVTINGIPAPLLMVSAYQVNAQLPFGITGAATLRLTTPNGSIEQAIDVLEFAPAIFDAAVFHPDGSAVTRDWPAAGGEQLTIYCTGLGSLRSQVPAGNGVDGPVPTTRPVALHFSDTDAPVSYAGAAPGLAGVYKVVFDVPAGTAGGQHSMFLSVAGTRSNPIQIFVG